MSQGQPLVSVAVPVYNGEALIKTTLESVLAQTFEDFELLISDNASDDGTREICESIAGDDRRVRYVRNSQNIGQNQNFRQVLTIFEGSMVRLMSVGDLIEPTYLEATVDAMTRRPGAAVATTYQQHVADDGTAFYEEYTGPRPDSEDPIERLDVMLRLLTESPLWIDPVYSLIQRRALDRTDLIRPIRFGDQVFAAELALAGPFVHVPEMLATRHLAPTPSGRAALRRYTGAKASGLTGALIVAKQRPLMLRYLRERVWSEPELRSDRLRALAAFGVYLTRLGRRRLHNLQRKTARRFGGSHDNP